MVNYGMNLVPLQPRSKIPSHKDWGNNGLSTIQEVEAYFKNNAHMNVGVNLGKSNLCSLDIDCLDSFYLMCAEFGISISELKKYPTIQGKDKGYRLLFSKPDADIQYQKLNWPRKDDDKKKFTVFELRIADSQQRQDVLPPSIHPETGKPYVWLVEPGSTIPEPPEWLLAIWKSWETFKPQLVAMCPWNKEPAQYKIKEFPKKTPSSDCVFTAWNQAHNIRATLEHYGYVQKSRDRYLSPHSTTKLAGVHVFDTENKCWVHHASDPLCSDDTGKPVAPFDLYCEYEHGGNIGKAAHTARDILGMAANVVSIDSGMDIDLVKNLGAEKIQDEEDHWLVWEDDFCKGFTAISWLIKGWLPKNSSMMLFGPSGVGKSFFVLDWCLRIASNGEIKDWNGHKVRHGTVVYLAGEGHHGLKGRIKAWRQHNNYTGKLDIIISKSGCDLNTQSGYKKVCDGIDCIGVEPALIVVDTLHRFFDGDENSAKDSRSMINVCLLLQQRYKSSSTLLVHHVGVSGEKRARGSGSWKGAMEVELSLSNDGDAIALECTKGKDTKPPHKTFFQLQQVPIDGIFDEDGDQVTSAVVVQCEAPEKSEKVDRKLEGYMKWFEKIWTSSGCDTTTLDDGSLSPTVSRNAIISYLTTHEGLSEGAAKNHTKPSLEGKMVGYLIENSKIDKNSLGYFVSCPLFSSALLLIKK